MEAALAVVTTPPQMRRVKPGRPGRTDVFRPAICPEGHAGRIRIDRIEPAGPFHSRVGYRCSVRGTNPKTGRRGDIRHRFTDRTPIDPLPRRHPTHAHSYSQDNCPTCEHIYAPDEGPRAGRHFLFAAADIASLLMGVGRGDPIREVAAQTRRDALRFRPPSASHRGLAYEPTPEDLAWLASVASYDDLGHGYYALDTEDTDWDVRFRRGLGEDDYVSDDWDDGTDEPPSDVELLRSYAESVASDRGPAVPVVLPSPAEMVDDERFLSNSFALGAEYVDAFGPAVVAPFYVKEWPESIVVDSQPVRRRALVGDEAARVASDFLCEIFGAQDGISKELILLYPAGGKDQESIKEVFGQKTGVPKWIVTDGESAMPKAIAAAFPGIIHYRCEEHLRDDAKDAAARDRVRDPEVLAAIETAQYTPAHWERLKAIAAVRVTLVHSELRTWIAANEALVLHQYELRRLHPRYPRSTGGVEGPLGSVRRDLDVRRVALRNRRRLVIVLELMRVALIHKARPERYAAIVRQQLEAGRLGRMDWKSHWDHKIRVPRGGKPKVRNSLIEYRDLARERSALAREDETRRETAEGQARRTAEAWAQAEADGGQPTLRVRREEPPSTTARAGDKVSDVPHLMALWDFSKNVGIDPAATAAQANQPVDWVCRKHEDGDPDGRWPGHLHEWRQPPGQRARKNPGCRFCMRRAVCVANSLRTSHPRLARSDEWDYEANDPTGVTPDNKLSGSMTIVSWLCAIHGRYPMVISYRARLGQGCVPCSLAAGQEKRRESMRKKGRDRYALADRARARLASEREDPVEELFQP